MKRYEREQQAALNKAFIDLLEVAGGYSVSPAQILEVATKHDVTPCALEGKLFDEIDAHERAALRN